MASSIFKVPSHPTLMFLFHEFSGTTNYWMDYVLTRLYLYIFEDQRSLLLISGGTKRVFLHLH
jgi:hypothetical protein